MIVQYPPEGLRRAPFHGACSGLTFRRVEGLILSKAYKRRAETFATEVAVAKALVA